MFFWCGIFLGANMFVNSVYLRFATVVCSQLLLGSTIFSFSAHSRPRPQPEKPTQSKDCDSQINPRLSVNHSSGFHDRVWSSPVFSPTLRSHYPVTLVANSFSFEKEGKIKDANFRKYHSVTKLNKDKTKLLSVRPNNRVNLYDSSNRKWLRSYPTDIYHIHNVWSLSTSPDDQYLVTGGGSNESSEDQPGPLKSIIFWELNTANSYREIKPLFVICNVPGSITSLEFSRSGQYLAASLGVSASNNLILFDVNKLLGRRSSVSYTKLESEAKKIAAHPEWVNTLAFSPDDRLIAASGTEGKLIIRNVSNLRPYKTLDLAQKGAASKIIFSKLNGINYLFAALPNGQIAWWNLDDGNFTKDNWQVFQNEAALSLDLNADNKEIITGSNNSKIKLLNLEDKKEIASMTDQSPEGVKEYRSVLFYPYKKDTFISSNSFGLISTWKLAENQNGTDEIGPDPVPGSESCKTEPDTFQVIVGFILVLFALLSLYLLYATRLKSFQFISQLYKSLSELMKVGESLDEPLDNSAETLDDSGEKIYEIAEILSNAKIQEVLIDVVEEENCEDIKVNLKGVIDNTREVSKNIECLKDYTEKLSKKIEKLFCELGNHPSEVATKDLLNNIALTFGLLGSILLLSGCWFIYAGNQGRTICIPEQVETQENNANSSVDHAKE